jgi:3-isopropylmalate dehydrogenase
MLLRYSFKLKNEAASIEGAVSSVLAAGYRTRDLVRPGQTGLTTAEMGRKVAEAVVPQSKPQMAIR